MKPFCVHFVRVPIHHTLLTWTISKALLVEFSNKTDLWLLQSAHQEIIGTLQFIAFSCF